jgi:tetratricopeptide (TPR) repeat protein
MNSDLNANLEFADAKKVDIALAAIKANDPKQAISNLVDVIKNTPANYSNFEEDEESIAIKFWDQDAFTHYVNWHKNHGTANKIIRWIGNAYPRAHYYFGFICGKIGRYEQAIMFLDKGKLLEPTNPKFVLEKAFALMPSKRYREVLDLYNLITDVSPFVSACDIAIARRGQGFALIEMMDLDNAEAAFNMSLKFEPGSEIALNELRYIDRLRRGGKTLPSKAVTSK